jgi:hypothetical protein
MAAAGGPLTPVQVQKLFFILDRKIALQIGGPHFSFVPYHYGPFDATVYHSLDALAEQGLIATEATGSARRYGISTSGLHTGLAAFGRLPIGVQNYVRALAAWIRSLTFAQLVSAVYDAWPEMKAKSIFRG